MTMEVALLQWGDGNSGVRLLGRSTASELVDLVRQHLVEELETGLSEREARPSLHLVPPCAEEGGELGGEGEMDRGEGR